MTYSNLIPSMRRLRDGRKQQDLRTTGHWKAILENHVRVSHGGKQAVNCAGCREIESRLQAR